MSFFRRLIERSGRRAVEGPLSSPPGTEGQWSAPGIRTEIDGEAATVTVDLDEFGSEARPVLLDELSQASGLPVFAGSVEHGYAVRSLGSHARCPRCNAGTRQQMAHFVYATNIAPRVMFAPAGYFCTTCPTVIVDEDLIATGMKRGYRFRAVVGVDHGGGKRPTSSKHGTATSPSTSSTKMGWWWTWRQSTSLAPTGRWVVPRHRGTLRTGSGVERWPNDPESETAGERYRRRRGGRNTAQTFAKDQAGGHATFAML